MDNCLANYMFFLSLATLQHSMTRLEKIIAYTLNIFCSIRVEWHQVSNMGTLWLESGKIIYLVFPSLATLKVDIVLTQC